MLDALELRGIGMAARPPASYVDTIARLARRCDERSLDELQADEVQQQLRHLLREHELARSSVNLCGCA